MKWMAALTFLLSFSPWTWSAPTPSPHALVELISNVQSAQPGSSVRIGVRFDLEDDWHIYWKNPGDSGGPPQFQWTAPAGVNIGPTHWPAPEKIPAGPIMSFGYPERVLFMHDVQVPANYSGIVLPIDVQAKWLICKDICLPAQAKLHLELPIRKEPPVASSTAQAFENTQAKLPIPFPLASSVSVSEEATQWILRFSVPAHENIANAYFYPDLPNLIEHNEAQTLQVLTTDPSTGTDKNSPKRVTLTLKKSLTLTRELPTRLDGVLNLAKKAYLISTPLPLHAPPLNWSNFLEAFLFALFGGMILNLMPCVFPVLSIKALGLIRHAHESKHTVRMHGLFYGAGVLCTFWILAGVLFLLRAGGEKLGWGFQLQSPIFVTGLIAFLFLMALNLLGIFEISPRWSGAGQTLAGREGFLGSFFTGALAVVVATPCTAPFMGSALGFALSQPAYAGMGVFTGLGVGLAFPYVALSMAPSLSRFLPKPGRWMETFKQSMAFPLFATIIWLVWVLTLQRGADAMTPVLSMLLGLSLSAWIMGRWKSNLGAWTAGAVLVVSLALGLQPSSAPTNDWQPYTREKLEEHLAAQHPVFVDFTAAWCVTCQVNERVALRSDRFLKLIRERKIQLLRGDWTHSDPAITRALAEFGRTGVPLYLYYSGKPGVSPQILPQILTTAILEEELSR